MNDLSAPYVITKITKNTQISVWCLCSAIFRQRIDLSFILPAAVWIKATLQVLYQLLAFLPMVKSHQCPVT